MNKGIGVLKKLQHILPRKTLVTIHKSFIWPHLDYRDIIYDQPKNESFSKKTESYQHNKALAITGTSDLSYPYVHSIFTLLLIKQVFEKIKSLRAASEIRTQFYNYSASYEICLSFAYIRIFTFFAFWKINNFLWVTA